MSQKFQGWEAVADNLRHLAHRHRSVQWPLDDGQRASLRCLADRLPHHGVLLADEVGMGKTRIAVALARCVIQAGGRVAVLVPPGLGAQWGKELSEGGLQAPVLLRSLQALLEPWRDEATAPSPWWADPVVLVSHRLAHSWHLGQSSALWRWALAPALDLASGRGRQSAWQNWLAQHPRAGRSQEWESALWRLACATVDALGPKNALAAANPAKRRLLELRSSLVSQAGLDGSQFGAGGDFQPTLGQAVGMCLGEFDLLVIDEAHKSRRVESGLTRLLEQILLTSDSTRRLGMTATPVELAVDDWQHTLARIGCKPQALAASGEGGGATDVLQAYAQASKALRENPVDPSLRARYAAQAQAFQQALQPYVLRRDKSELESVQHFQCLAGSPVADYRRVVEIPVEPQSLHSSWRKAVCAAEALSLLAGTGHQEQRLRLTLGNGHGVADLLQPWADQEPELAPLAEAPHPHAKREQRRAFWRGVIQTAFQDGQGSLYQHPAVLAAVRKIEALTGPKGGGKVLVFGRYTAPMKALTHLLNARAMWRALENKKPWPQAAVHEDEWPAVQAAYLQLNPSQVQPPDRASLDDQLARQYRHLERRRRAERDQLIARLQALSGRAKSTTGAVLRALLQPGAQYPEAPNWLARALLGDGLGQSAELPGDDKLMQDLEALLKPLLDRDVPEGTPKVDESEQSVETGKLTQRLRSALQESFGRGEGSLARRMEGDTAMSTRHHLQLAFNRPGQHPLVLVAQSVVGREGLNLHEACKDVVLLHLEWNPGVVEQQIGRVDRKGSLWEHQMALLPEGVSQPDELPYITLWPVIFQGSYDQAQWRVLKQRWDDLRAQLHGKVIHPQSPQAAGLPEAEIQAINALAPCFSPTRRQA